MRVEERDRVAILTLDRPKANAFDRELVADLSLALKETADAGGVVMTSSLSTMFSAGWDLPVLFSRDRKGMEEFLEAYCDLVRDIFVFGPPLVAALPGHAIAGGLIVAVACDERLATNGTGQFGLSEVALGVPVPYCCLEIFRHVIGHRATERLASTGENLSAERALSIGLVDRIVAADELLDSALERARLLAGRSARVHAAIKRRARSSALARFDQAREGDPFLDFWFGKDARERIAALVERLTGKN